MKIWNCIKLGALFVAFLFFNSCKTAKDLNDDSTLPKDFYERPVSENSKNYDEISLSRARKLIDSEISKYKCKNISDWAYAPIGSKACGGPVSYIAYPKSIEASILSRIKEFTDNQSEFNKKYEITSDCMLAAEPTAIKCVKGKAVLVYNFQQ